ncbi:MAG TPA: pyridoxal phosphate-dependent aminotransferase [Sulfurospirillum arcachonense]|nr:pyridoxal phosphate-dependent aminotransferase [Sulfurospirillum arcachonense]HIP44965.1 pyridoxal phosphate-dependent aminotransferase [Sulfurospirillum arcachonense]
MIAKRIEVLSESLTIAITTLAKEMKASGKDVLSFSAGEPDFGTPEVIKSAAIKAIQEGNSTYTPVPGTPEVLKAIQTKLKRDNRLHYETSEIVTNNGAKHSLFNLFQILLNKGDEVIIPAPYWVTYPEIVKYSEGIPVYINTDDASEFKITPEQLKNAITDKTKVLILNTPSNPTGSVYSKKDLEALAQVLKGTDVLVFSDEMYEKIMFDGTEFVSVASISEDMFKRTVTINGLSKSVAMTGWRFGYMATPIKELTDAVKKLQSQSTSNINSITQKAVVPALLGEADSDIEMMRKAFEKRRNLAMKMFNSIEGLSVVKPNGAFYLYVNFKKVTNDSVEFCKRLLAQKGVATVPGIGFGTEGYFRFSFATDEKSIIDGINRIENFVKNYK